MTKPSCHSTRVAVLGSFPPLRAISSYCYEFTQALIERTGVDFLSFKALYPGWLYPGGGLNEDTSFPPLHHSNLTIHRRLSWYNPFSWLWEGIATDARLLHAQWWSFPLVLIYMVVCAGFKLRGRPVVFTVHNVLPHEKGNIWKHLTKLLFRLGDHFIVHTAVNKEQMLAEYGVPQDRVSIIPHGTLDFQNRGGGGGRDQLRRDMGYPPDSKVILLFGAIRPYKGMSTALEAFAQVAAQVPAARLLIVGKLWESWRPYAEMIERHQLQDKITTVLDYIPANEVYRYFEAADLVILPYHHFSSQSGVATTALAFRKPMVVSRVGGLADLALARFSVPPQDPAALARAIIQSFADPDALGQMAAHSASVAQSLRWSAIAEKTLSVYQEVISLKKDGSPLC